AVEVGELLEEVEVLEEDGAARAGGEGVLVVGDGNARGGGERGGGAGGRRGGFFGGHKPGRLPNSGIGVKYRIGLTVIVRSYGNTSAALFFGGGADGEFQSG